MTVEERAPVGRQDLGPDEVLFGRALQAVALEHLELHQASDENEEDEDDTRHQALGAQSVSDRG